MRVEAQAVCMFCVCGFVAPSERITVLYLKCPELPPEACSKYRIFSN